MTTLSPFDPFELTPSGQLSPQWIAWLGRVLSETSPAPAAGAPPSVDWEPVLAACDAHAITPLLYLRLRDTRQLPVLPQPVRDALFAAFQDNTLRTLRFEQELGRISDAFRTEDIRLMLLKGLATGRLVYGSPAERPIGDLDLLVPFADMERARRALRNLAYEGIGWPGLDRLSRWQHAFRSEMPMLCTIPERYGLVTELHWSLLEIPYYIERIDMNSVWDAAVPLSFHDDVLLPDPATLLVHGAAHVALHHSRELRLIWLLDLDRLARWRALQWDAVLERASTWGLGKALLLPLMAAKAWLATPIPEAVHTELERLALDPVGEATWGLGDERPDRARRRASASWLLFNGRQRLRYAAWLGFRTVLRPLELSSRPGPAPSTDRSKRAGV